MRDSSLKCLYHTNFEKEVQPKVVESSKSKDKRYSSVKKHSNSPDRFYIKMQKLEEQKSKRMLQLLIDKEKKEISELNKGANSKRR